MLPDLRIVIAAVVSTFILTVGVGFFASSRLIHEQMTARVDSKGQDDTPINRIALNWPEPTRVDRHLDLDFAISAKGSRNPVRDVAPAPAPAPAEKIEAAPQPARAETSDMVSSLRQETPPSPAQAPVIAAAPVSAPATIATQESTAPQPEAVIAPQEPAAIVPEPSVATEKDVEPRNQEALAQEAAAQEPLAQKPLVQEPDVSVAKAPEPVEETTSAPDPAPRSVQASQPTETPQSADMPQPAAAQPPKTDTQVLVHLNETAASESTGSIAGPAPDAPGIPLPAARPKLALRHEAGDAAHASRPAHAEPIKAPVSERKRVRRTVIRTRPAQRPQPAPAQTPQMQPFDFFGLFRTTPAPARIPQVAKPTTPIS